MVSQVLQFDVYGTLIDWDSGLYAALQPLLNRYLASASWSREQALLTFDQLEVDMKACYPTMLHPDILSRVHEAMEEKIRALSPLDTTLPPLTSDEERHAFGFCPKTFEVFPDTPDALQRLAQHFKLVVLSNIDNQCFAHTLARMSAPAEYPACVDTYTRPPGTVRWLPQNVPRSRSPFTFILTAQDTGVYKPDLLGFRTMIARLSDVPELAPNAGKEGLFVVANDLRIDHVPAQELGIRSVWIDRRGIGEEAAIRWLGGKKWQRRFTTLGEMADAVERGEFP
ncbi:HAD-like protein [Fistulina hepatica ATCC 64428]|uniref:HAD-like protein n=1 Tax=Fistulina hepatica ATCC 64428 TaxID=1128425 RepID=A0A0D7A9N6_9AGAR|nr:HAD-like protein [Fistulina hepatica ATCC 64428]